jgi:hypothetical protein
VQDACWPAPRQDAELTANSCASAGQSFKVTSLAVADDVKGTGLLTTLVLLATIDKYPQRQNKKSLLRFDFKFRFGEGNHDI